MRAIWTISDFISHNDFEVEWIFYCEMKWKTCKNNCDFDNKSPWSNVRFLPILELELHFDIAIKGENTSEEKNEREKKSKGENDRKENWRGKDDEGDSNWWWWWWNQTLNV